MSKVSLRLSVKAKNWRMNDDKSSEADAEFQLVRTKVLNRDKYTCLGCGFTASKWQEVHHVNDDHSDNRPDNLVTVCNYCHMCQHIGRAGQMQEAVLVWLPEISQAELHHLVRAGQVAQRWAETVTMQRNTRADTARSANQIREGAGRLLATLRERQDEAEERIGTSDLQVLANIMLAMPDDMYDQREDVLHGFRMLPLGVRYQDNQDTMDAVVDSWMEPGGPFLNLKPQSWLGMFKSSLSKIS